LYTIKQLIVFHISTIHTHHSVELSRMPRPRGRRAYNRVADQDEAAPADVENQQEPQAEIGGETQEQDEIPAEPDEDEEDDGTRIKVVVMDPAQNRFEVEINPKWSVERFKREGTMVHKIPSGQQRLIYMGRLLTDDKTLADSKIDKEGIIVHLFPKPRVVVQGSSSHLSEEEKADDDDFRGAHVPQIVLDPDEAQMRSSILVLGSAEIMDAQNNVKLLSFLLLIITSMELLALFTIMLGVPDNVPGDVPVDDNTTDDMTHHHHSPDVRTWRNTDYFDLALNLFGFYSAMLGIKATTENTRRLAFRYLVSTIICGIAWNAFYYYLNFEVEQEIDQERHKMHPEEPLLDTQAYLVQAFFAILIPMMIWCMCCMRAHQFHYLIQEAELEAEHRIQHELTMQEEGNVSDRNDSRVMT
jgi:hypothetical protein